MYLTRSDFRAAEECPAKLFYRKQKLPTRDDGSDFARLLRDGAYMVQAAARVLFPGGRAMPRRTDPRRAHLATVRALAHPQATLFGATVANRHRLARPDVLVRDGERLNLYQVRASSFDADKNRRLVEKRKPNLFHREKGSGIRIGWEPVLQEAAFDTSVVRAAFRKLEVRTHLVLPDTSAPTDIDGLHTLFEIRFTPGDELGEAMEVEFTGDPDALRARPFLAVVDVTEDVDEVLPCVEQRSKVYVGSLFPQPRKLEHELTLGCRGCEFNTGGADGKDVLLRECWEDAASVTPNVLDLFWARGVPGIDELMMQRRIGLDQVSADRLGLDNRTARRRIQLLHTLDGTEWIGDGLAAELAKHAPPLHFIDFEVARPRVPYHAGMRPYEAVAFQWSCHTLHADGTLQHREWINQPPRSPNFEFARTLMEHLDGRGGTVLTWSGFEKSTLGAIAALCKSAGKDGAGLAGWLRTIVQSLVDMEKIALEHYFHPAMKGKTSIKYVTEAVWKANPALRERFPKYVADDGQVVSPYRSMRPVMVNGSELTVADGARALLAYDALTRAAARGQDATELRDRLLDYCELDTAAMVMIWLHWSHAAAQAAV